MPARIPQGPNVRRLIIRKTSLLMVPPGTGNAFGAAVSALTKPGNIASVVREATRWVETAIAAVRQAADPNEWRDADDEAIAGEILRQIEARTGRRPLASAANRGAAAGAERANRR